MYLSHTIIVAIDSDLTYIFNACNPIILFCSIYLFLDMHLKLSNFDGDFIEFDLWLVYLIDSLV